jgi:zona occludens toxin (predicted ATPase)
MVKFFSGTPGSGKSFHTAKLMLRTLRLKRNVITTVAIDMDIVSKNGRRKTGDYVYIPIGEINVPFLYKYAMEHHEKGNEGQTLLVIDECQILFDSRGFQKKDRMDWILFFSRHRHLGYDVILISQQDRMIDRQIRGMFEYEYKHRKVNNFGPLWLIPWTFFVVIQTWYGTKHLRIGSEFLVYKKRIGRIYDSYTMFDDYIAEYAPSPSEEPEPPEECYYDEPPKPKGLREQLRRFFNPKAYQGSDAEVRTENIKKEEIQ